MVHLIDSDIRTREVLDWRGVHIFHAWMSSCSQKLRIFLNHKSVAWQRHELNLGESESYSAWFLGINPRGLVPVLVWDGAVHIESNDIIALLDTAFPDPCLIPDGQEAEVTRLLGEEDDLHLDLRTISFRFVYGRTGSPKTPDVMATYRESGSATVGGVPDREKRGAEIDFYERLARDGITDAAVRCSASKFRAAFDDLDRRLATAPYFLGERLTVLDIAWFVYASRLYLAGYPFARLHPAVAAWHQRMVERPEFAGEVALPAALRDLVANNREAQERAGTTLSEIAGL